MKYVWQDLPKPLNVFTSRNTTMRNLNTGEIIQHYSANTKLTVVQKCVTTKGTFYRTSSAAHHFLNFAFEATALGLPNEIAPSAPSHDSLDNRKITRSKQTTSQKVALPKDGEGRVTKGTLREKLKKLFHK